VDVKDLEVFVILSYEIDTDEVQEAVEAHVWCGNKGNSSHMKRIQKMLKMQQEAFRKQVEEPCQ
jgi:hypothetical protein